MGSWRANVLQSLSPTCPNSAAWRVQWKTLSSWYWARFISAYTSTNPHLALKKYSQNWLKTSSGKLEMKRRGQINFCNPTYWKCINRSFSFDLYIYGRRNKSDKFAPVNSLVFAALFNAPQKACLKAGGNLRLWFLFFNLHHVSKSPVEFSTFVSAFMELRSNANLPCLVNLSFRCFFEVGAKLSRTFILQEPEWTTLN